MQALILCPLKNKIKSQSKTEEENSKWHLNRSSKINPKCPR